MVKDRLPELRMPAVWLPYGILGISTSQPITIPQGAFGPFEGQILVGDQGMSMLSRVFLEKVNGEYQGASFAFRSGFRSGDNLRKYYIHTIKLEGVRERDNFYSLVHPTAYYTLNNIPEGQKLLMSEVSTKNSAVVVPAKPATAGKSTASTAASKPVVKPASAMQAKAPTFDSVKGMLTSYTCLACHNPDKKLVGPSFRDIAKRKYTADKIVQLIHNPQPQNWPDYPTPMPPMPQVKREDALKISAYINSIK